MHHVLTIPRIMHNVLTIPGIVYYYHNQIKQRIAPFARIYSHSKSYIPAYTNRLSCEMIIHGMFGDIQPNLAYFPTDILLIPYMINCIFNIFVDVPNVLLDMKGHSYIHLYPNPIGGNMTTLINRIMNQPSINYLLLGALCIRRTRTGADGRGHFICKLLFFWGGGGGHAQIYWPNWSETQSQTAWVTPLPTRNMIL